MQKRMEIVIKPRDWSTLNRATLEFRKETGGSWQGMGERGGKQEGRGLAESDRCQGHGSRRIRKCSKN